MSAATTNVRIHAGLADRELLLRLQEFLIGKEDSICLSKHPGCLNALANGLRHKPYFLEAVTGEKTVGFLALAYVRSLLFGRFLVSLPYLNYGGVFADDEATERKLIDSAVDLADRLNVRYLELRYDRPISHPSLTHNRSDKVHMQLELPTTSEDLWQQISSKVRNQVKKAKKQEFEVVWGGEELLADFYTVFSRNMRDLGTPVFSKKLFRSFLDTFPDRSELCVVRDGDKPVAGALLLHGWGITEVPSASALRSYNPTCANMLLYWHLLERAVDRGQTIFDFGRSSADSKTYRFKKQWAAKPVPAQWQYYLRSGDLNKTRRDNPRYQRFIAIWQRLPVSLTRLLGPAIVRGIP